MNIQQCRTWEKIFLEYCLDIYLPTFYILMKRKWFVFRSLNLFPWIKFHRYEALTLWNWYFEYCIFLFILFLYFQVIQSRAIVLSSTSLKSICPQCNKGFGYGHHRITNCKVIGKGTYHINPCLTKYCHLTSRIFVKFYNIAEWRLFYTTNMKKNIKFARRFSSPFLVLVLGYFISFIKQT